MSAIEQTTAIVASEWTDLPMEVLEQIIIPHIYCWYEVIGHVDGYAVLANADGDHVEISDMFNDYPDYTTHLL